MDKADSKSSKASSISRRSFFGLGAAGALLPWVGSRGESTRQGEDAPIVSSLSDPASGSKTDHSQATSHYFTIRVVDEVTGRGVPLVELKTTNSILYYTDSNGIAAFYEPGLMDREVWFGIKSPGYEFPQNLFGERGVALKATSGGNAVLKIKRLNLAERLYRLTGEGIYRDSVLVGTKVPVQHPLLDGQVMGQDTVMPTPYRGKIYWFFGDTAKPSFPLGNFGTSGATSEWPGQGGLDPAVGVNLTYFTNAAGFSRPMIPSSAIPGPGPKWTDGVMVVKDSHGSERLVAHYVRVKTLGTLYEQGLMIFNNKTESFDRLVRLSLNAALVPAGRPFRVSVHGKRYYYFPSPHPAPLVRVRDNLNDIRRPESYEGFTCLAAGSRYDKEATRLDRDSDGRLIYSWKLNTPPLTYKQQQELIASGRMKPEEKGLVRLKNIATGEEIDHTTGTVYWNDYRQRWVMIAMKGLNQVLYAESDTPIGPWVYATEIATHGHYTFYWPGQCPFFDQGGGRIIYFAGTYTNTFSGNPCQTPRYNYNQLMYRISLDNPQLFLPVPIYQVKSAGGVSRFLTREGVTDRNAWDRIESIPFFALPPGQPRNGALPIFPSAQGGLRAGRAKTASSNAKSQPLFYALPAKQPSSDQILAGKWRIQAKSPKGSALTFTTVLKLKGSRIIAGESHEEVTITGGTFRNGKLSMNAKQGKSFYLMTGTLKDGKLAGKFQEINRPETGTWEAVPIGFLKQQETSTAVVPLYEYRQAGTVRRVYSTNPELKEQGFTRAAEPICRVWRNPLPRLILDRHAVAIPMVRKSRFRV